MRDSSRLTYLRQHYYELQGLRFAPLWLGLLFAAVFNSLTGHWVAHGSAGRVLPMFGLYTVEIFWYWLVGRYYRWRFGKMEREVSGNIGISFAWVWVFSAIVQYQRFHWVAGAAVLILLCPCSIFATPGCGVLNMLQPAR